MDKYRENFGNGGEFVDNNDYSKEIAGEFEGRTEEEIVVEAKKGNVRAQEYVISKYEGFVKAKSKSYFLIGADKEDIYLRQLEILIMKNQLHLGLLLSCV